jgi:hypothetical protein
MTQVKQTEQLDYFDYDSVKTKMEALNVVFTEFMQVLDSIDVELNDNIDSDDEGALKGVVAKQLLTSWNACSNSFITFRDKFDDILYYVNSVATDNTNFEESSKTYYGD